LQKVLHFDSPAPVYTADACVITCFDARFDAAIRKLVKRLGIMVFDHLKVPGAAKDAEFALQALRTSLRLHRPQRVVIVAHNDCGAWPGIAPEVVAADTVRSAGFLKESEPSLQYETYFADFDGIYRVG
jgi:carbonic anhydrase